MKVNRVGPWRWGPFACPSRPGVGEPLTRQTVQIGLAGVVGPTPGMERVEKRVTQMGMKIILFFRLSARRALSKLPPGRYVADGGHGVGAERWAVYGRTGGSGPRCRVRVGRDMRYVIDPSHR